MNRVTQPARPQPLELTIRQNRARARILAAGLLLLAGGCRGGAVDGAEVALPTVEVCLVKEASGYDRGAVYTGEVRARREALLGFERPGRLVAVAVDDGANVRAGDLLARLDDAQLQAQRAVLAARRAAAAATLAELCAGARKEEIDRQRAAVQVQEAEVQELRQQQLRSAELVQQRVAGTAALDDLTQRVQAGSARLLAAQASLAELLAGTRPERVLAQQALVDELDASLAELQVQLDQCRLLAPFAGVVASRRVDEGAVLAAGQSVLRLLEAAPFEARVGLPAALAAALRVGAELPIRVRGADGQAQLLAVLPELDLATRTQTVSFLLDREVAAVPGDTVQLPLPQPVAEAGCWLPLAALQRAPRGLWSCLCVDAAGVVCRAAVEVVHSESERAFVRGTLQGGEQVIVAGGDRVVPGQRVRAVLQQED